MQHTQEYLDNLMSRIFAPCKAKDVPHSLYVALSKNLVPREFVEEAEKLVNSYPYPRKATTALPARSLYNDHSWDNVVRAAEEDR